MPMPHAVSKPETCERYKKQAFFQECVYIMTECKNVMTLLKIHVQFL